MTEIKDTLPFITVIGYGKEEYVGIIINQSTEVTTFYDLNAVLDIDKPKLLQLGEIWWWESNRQFPITVFCKDQIKPLAYAIKTLSTKDTNIILGPVVNLETLAMKRVKRKSIQLVRRPK